MAFSMSFIVFSPINSLADGANYQSKSTISFKKGPTEPEKEDETVIPGGKEAVADGGEKAAQAGKTPGAGSGTKLPKTATNNYNLLVLGLLLFAAGIVLYTIKERKKLNYKDDIYSH